MLPDDISEAEKYEPFKRMTDENQRQQYFDLCVDHTMRVHWSDESGTVILRQADPRYAIRRVDAEAIVRSAILRVTRRPFARKT